MDQHLIPQQISSYEFRLVGEMTLAQFLKLAAGIVTAYLIYSSGLIFIIRLPLATILLLLGVGMAFLPINGRPLERWILTFIGSVYSPTIYTWRKPSASNKLDSLPSPRDLSSVVSPYIKKKKDKKEGQGQIDEKKEGKQEKKVVKPSPQSSVDSSDKQEDVYNPELIKMVRESKKNKEKSVAPEYLDIPLPATPNVPNIINGIVLDEEGKFIEGAIVEIQDREGSPKRAMRTNSLGQFQTATPLPDGSYLIIAEKEPYQFAIIEVEAKGEIIPPLQVKARKTASA